MNYLSEKRVLLTGGNGFLGSFIKEKLNQKNCEDIIIPKSSEMDLRLWRNCLEIVKDIDIVIHVAGRTGGIEFNKKYPGQLFYDNLIMNTHLMEAARQEDVDKFVGIGTVCSYPKFTSIPFQEKNIWEGYPEETNASYGLSKKMMLVQSQAYRQQYGFNSIHLLLVNLYGPGDSFDLNNSHVIAALIRKFVEAVKYGDTEVEVWGTGNVSREFLYVEDCADAIVLATEKYNKSDPINIGIGSEITIKQLAELIAELTGYENKIVWNTKKPDGQPRRCLDVSKAEKEFDFIAKTGFREGLKKTIQWYQR